MSAVLIFLPLVAAMAVLGAIWKLAARILRYDGVTWPLAFLVGVTIVGVNTFCRSMLTFNGITLPPYLVWTVGPAVPVFVGAWCFHDRATRADGIPLGWPGALKLSGLALALFMLSGLVLFGTLMAFLPAID